MAAFVRLDNNIIRRRAEGITNPDDVGLFALLSVFLSIPDFRTPTGGLHAAVAKHCRNGRHTINAAWQRLSAAGYLKRTRLPDGDFVLRDIYALQSRPDLTTPAVSHLNYAQSHHTWDRHTCFTPPTEDFTPVSSEALMDARLSLAAKGLYAMIRPRLLLSARVSGVSIGREGLRRSSGLGECAFRRIWHELRDTGYLTMTHVWDATQKKMIYLYDLAETRELADANAAAATAATASAAAASDDLPSVRWDDGSHSRAAGAAQDATGKESAPLMVKGQAEPFAALTDDALTAARKPVDELSAHVRDQIEYDVLCTRDNPQPLLDCAVEVISRVLHMPPGEDITIKGAHYSAFEVQRTLSALDANEAEYAIQAAHSAIERARGKGTPIQNVRAYLLSCLFTAKTDFATSLVY